MKRNYVLSSAAENYSAKLAKKYVGPFTVTKRYSPTVYELANSDGNEIGKYAIVDLKPFHPNSYPSNGNKSTEFDGRWSPSRVHRRDHHQLNPVSL